MSTTFPTVFESIPLAALIDTYAAAPTRLRGALAGLSPSEIRAKPVPGKWSILEIAMHLADSELVGAMRIRLSIAQPGATLVTYEQDCWAERLEYQRRDDHALGQALGLFELTRATSAALFLGLSDADWAREAVHPRFGRVTVRNVLEIYADHGERHVEQIVDRRRLLGTPVDLAPMLTARLY